MYHRRYLAIPFLILVGLASTAWAETWYISDQLVVSMRTAPQDNAEVVTYLRTDAALEVLGSDGDYTHVRTKAGEVGYIKNQYLTADTPKAIRIDRLQKERDRLAAQVKDLEAQVARATTQGDEVQKEIYAELQTTRGQIKQLQKDLDRTGAELKQVSGSYSELQKNAKNVVAITTERDRLLTTNNELTTQLAGLEEERDSLMQTGVIKWFFSGAGVLFIGWIIGKMSGSRRRRSLL